MADEAAPTVNDGKGLPLICIDSSEHSIRALEWYFLYLHKEGETIGLAHVHVLPDMPGYGLFGHRVYEEAHAAKYFKDGEPVATMFNQHQIQESVRESKAIADRAKERCQEKGINAKVLVQTSQDSIGHTICKIAQENNASMIVIGQRGLGTIRRTFLGSVSDYVLHHAQIPVLVVPPLPEEK